jgi:hypothetical protein
MIPPVTIIVTVSVSVSVTDSFNIKIPSYSRPDLPGKIRTFAITILRPEEELQRRNDAVRIIRGFGNDQVARSIWSKLVGYSQRSIVESMISRWKRTYGGSLKSRCDQRKKVEVRLKAEMINQMIDAAA